MTRRLWALALTLPALAMLSPAQAPMKLIFEVTVAKGLLACPTDGRVLLVIGSHARPEPRASLGDVDHPPPAVLGADGDRFRDGVTVRLDENSAIFPLSHLSKLPRGDYIVQAVFDHNRDLRLPGAPGNLVSEPRKVTLDPGVGGVVRIELTRALPDEMHPADTDEVKYVKLRSEQLSRFYGRSIFLRAGVILPKGHARDADKRYPLLVHIGGFGTRYTAVRGMMSRGSSFRRVWDSADATGMILLHLDGAGPLGDPYQVNSANHGPFGDAVTQELIPHVEKRFRGIGQGWARVTDGHSTGGWVSLALQIFYPDFFQGAWSHAPDPVDFRAFELMNIYDDTNAYTDAAGRERSACRDIDGKSRYTMRYEVQSEVVLGRGDRWTLSGKDWASWNATFGPRGKDGLPVPLWDRKTGKIDRSVLAHWKHYDLRLHLEKHWPTLAPKLAGKLRVWVGEMDDYYLNNAVHLLDASLQRAKPASGAKFTYATRQGHAWRGLSDLALLKQMGDVVEAARSRR